MVYRTKKTNRNKQKKSRKNIYTGGGKTEEQIPTLSSNLNSVVNLGVSAANDIAYSGIEKIGESVGIDVNKSASETVSEITDNLKNAVNALNSPEGEELKKEAGELIKDSLDVLKPSINKAEEILSEGAEKLTKTGTSMVMTALNEFPPIFAATELSKAVTAGTQAGQTVAKLITTGAEAGLKLEKQKEKANTLIEKGKQLFSNFVNKGNEYAAKTLENAQSAVNNYGKKLMNKNVTMKKANNMFKKYNNQAQMIGGRINKSQSEFLEPYIKKSNTRKKLRMR